MTRERLEKLSLESLHEVARREDLDIPDGADTATVIELILEAYEEDREEREALNSHPISLEKKKYALTRDEDYRHTGEDTVVLPEQYNESRIVLLLRDPAWAFAYWDLRETDVKKFKAEPGFGGLFLRVHEISGPVFTGHNSVDFFDIPIQLSDMRWYINLPKQGTNYCIQLLYMKFGVPQVIVHSNVIQVPRGSVSEDWARGDSIDPYDMLIALSGLENLGIPSYDQRIPQRIISMLDAQYLR
jgi:hypothetical protein